MPRIADASIPEDEPLYRSVPKEHVADGQVLAVAVEVPACSFNRSKYSAPEAVFVASRPKDNGILEITPRELPPPIPRSEAVPYEFVAADDPCPREDPGNEAHCEIRVQRHGHDYNRNHKPRADIAAKARDALARKLRIHRAPS
jgi:hypothetical protein